MKSWCTLLAIQILKNTLGECPAMVERYATDRTGVFKELRSQEPDLATVSDKHMKNVFLACLHGARHKNHFEALGLSRNHEPIQMLTNGKRLSKRH